MKEDLKEPYHNCYVGVTKNCNGRWNRHKKSKYNVGKFIRFFDLSFYENMVVIFEGSKYECFELEKKLRPRPFIGLNEASGGHGGDTGNYKAPPKSAYTAERARKISESLCGRKKTEEHSENISKSLMSNGTRKGNKNPRAKKWTLISPNGVIHSIHGNLSETCKSLNLLESTLRYNKNTVVPEPVSNSYGGFRAKNEKSKELRMNTIGWVLYEESNDSGGV